MSQTPVKRSWLARLPPAVLVTLALGIITVLVILAFFAPPEGDANNVTGDQPVKPTVSITHLVDSLTVNHDVEVNGVTIAITQVMEATKFSDDRKRLGVYTIRVLVQANNKGKSVIGISYDSLVRLVLADGQVIAPKYISVKPVALPNVPQTGFFDFPVSTQVPLSSLTLRLGSDTVVAFGRG